MWTLLRRITVLGAAATLAGAVGPFTIAAHSGDSGSR